MSTVFIVFASDYDAANDTGIEGVFATRQAADAKIASLLADNDECEYGVCEYPVEGE